MGGAGGAAEAGSEAAAHCEDRAVDRRGTGTHRLDCMNVWLVGFLILLGGVGFGEAYVVGTGCFLGCDYCCTLVC